MSRARFPRRWSLVRMFPGEAGPEAHELSGHWTVSRALRAREHRRMISLSETARYRIVPSRWAPRRRIAAWIALELAQRGPQTTRQVKLAGVLPRMMVAAALDDLARTGTIAYEVPEEAGPVAEILTAVGLIDENSEIGRWRLLWNPEDVRAAAAVRGGGWTWAVDLPVRGERR